MLGFDSSNQSPMIPICGRRVKCPGTQTVVRGKDAVNQLWFVIPVVVASVDVDGTVILKVESVRGCEQFFHDGTLKHSLFSAVAVPMCARYGLGGIVSKPV